MIQLSTNQKLCKNLLENQFKIKNQDTDIENQTVKLRAL